MLPRGLTWAVGLSSTEPSVTNICPLHWKMLKGLSCTVSHLGPQNEIWFYIIELIYGTSLQFSWKRLRNWAKKVKLIRFLEFRMPFFFFSRLSKKWKCFTHPCDVSNVYALIVFHINLVHKITFYSVHSLYNLIKDKKNRIKYSKI